MEKGMAEMLHDRIVKTPKSVLEVRQEKLKGRQIPLSVGWLAESELLGIALEELGFELLGSTLEGGIVVTHEVTGKIKLSWEDNLTFTVFQLQEMGFE